MLIQSHEIEAEIERAMQTKLRNGCTTQAVVVKSWFDEQSPWLGFFFEDGRAVGEFGNREDGSHYQVLAVI